MKSIFFLILFCSAFTACGPLKSTGSHVKIIGGTPVGSGQWRSVVGLYSDSRLYCTATALSPRSIVTAAHCVSTYSGTLRKVESILVYAGSGSIYDNGWIELDDDGQPMNKGESMSEVESLGVHPNFYRQKPLGSFDFAYLVLKKPLDLPAEDYIEPLTNDAEKALVQRPGSSVTPVGFGFRTAEALAHPDQGRKFESIFTIYDALPEREEKLMRPPVPGYYWDWDPESEFVVKDAGTGACNGDSGGPLFARLNNGEWRQLGVVSRMYGNANCSAFASVYGSLSKAVCWIQDASKQSLNLPESYCVNDKAEAFH